VNPIEQLTYQQLEQDMAAKAEAKRLQEAALKAYLENASPMSDVQLAPLAGAIDSAFSTRVAPGIQAAEAKREPSTKKAEDILDSLMAPKAGTGSGALIKAARDDDKQDDIWARKKSDQVQDAFKNVKTEIGKEQNAAVKASQAFDEIDEALDSRNVERVMTKLSQVAKAVNKESGALSDSDVGRQFLQSFESQFSGFLAKLDKKEQFSEDDIRALAQNVAAARRSMATYTPVRLRSLAESYSNNPAFATAYQQNKPLYDATMKLAEGAGTSKVKWLTGGDKVSDLVKRIKGK
jgi:hypothetical protein